VVYNYLLKLVSIVVLYSSLAVTIIEDITFIIYKDLLLLMTFTMILFLLALILLLLVTLVMKPSS